MYNQKPELHARQNRHQLGALRTLSVDVTDKCNMNCEHCYAATYREGGLVPIQDLVRAVKEALDLGVFHFVLQGGEPLADRSRLLPVMVACEPHRSYINVVTNGWAVTAEAVQWLKDLGVDKLAFSMDSGIEAEHDARRGQGSFKRVLRGIECVQAAGLLASVSVVVTHQSLGGPGFLAAYKIACESKIRMDVQIAEPVGMWEGRNDLLFTPDDTDKVEVMRRICPRLPNGQRLINRDVFAGEEDTRCPAVSEFMAIAANGDVLPCNFLQYQLGNARTPGALAQARERLLKSHWFSTPCGRCLVGEDQSFIDKHVAPNTGRPKPMDAAKEFGV